MAAIKDYLRSVGSARLLRAVGVAPAPWSRFLLGQRRVLLDKLGLTSVIDVGANVGQYGRELRASGFAGHIYSFEPGAEALAALRRACARDDRWSAYGVALGSADGTAELHAWSGAATQAATLRAPVSDVVEMLGQPTLEQVQVTTLAGWLAENASVNPADTLLKVDVQGFERDVLAGAGDRLREFAALELEAPLGVWYDGQASLAELIELADSAGFRPVTIMTERFNVDWLGAPDVDVIFVRRSRSKVPG